MIFRQAHLEAVKQEADRRDFTHVNTLNAVLNKAERISQALKRGDMDTQYQALLANSLLEKGELAEKQRRYLMDELIAKQERDKELKRLQNEQKIQELNENRWKLMQQEEEVLKKRGVFNKIRERGVEFLADVEMGRITPSSFIKEEDIRIDSSKSTRPVKDIISYTQASIPTSNHRIQQLKQDKFKTLAQISWQNRPYRGEEDIRKYNPNLNISVYMTAKELIYDIFDEAWLHISQIEQEMQEAFDSKSHQSKNSKLAHKRSWLINRQVQSS